jgi:glycosyltransferase involved in cell wall biosynthesis
MGLKILVQNPYMEAGGAENRIRALVQGLINRPEISEVHFLYAGIESFHQVQSKDKFHLWQVKPARTAKVTREIIEKYKIDVVQLHNNQEIGVKGLEVAQEMGIPTVWVMHDFWPICTMRFLSKVWQADSEPNCDKYEYYKCRDCVGQFNYEVNEMQRNVINKCNVGIVPSNKIRSIFENNNLLNGKWMVVDPWIDLNMFYPDNRVQRKPWQVFFAGNFIPHKGINVLLKAWELVNRRLPMANLIVQGDQRCVNETTTLATNLGLLNVSFINHVQQDNLRTLYNESALTVFPSIWEETIGLIWIESLACGTPVICSNVGSMSELLKKGGEMFEPRNHVELAEKIVDLLLSPSKRNVYAKEGFEYVQGKFKPERAADDFIKLYYRLESERVGKESKV